MTEKRLDWPQLLQLIPNGKDLSGNEIHVLVGLAGYVTPISRMGVMLRGLAELGYVERLGTHGRNVRWRRVT